MNEEYYKEMVKFWLEQLLQNEVKYDISTKGGKNILIDIIVDKENIGKIIGRNGKLITCIRNLISSILNKNKENVVIKVIEKYMYVYFFYL